MSEPEGEAEVVALAERKETERKETERKEAKRKPAHWIDQYAVADFNDES